MPELSPGALRLPASHISIRVPWHGRAWDDAAEQALTAKFWRGFAVTFNEQLIPLLVVADGNTILADLPSETALAIVRAAGDVILTQAAVPRNDVVTRGVA